MKKPVLVIIAVTAAVAAAGGLWAAGAAGADPPRAAAKAAGGIEQIPAGAATAAKQSPAAKDAKLNPSLEALAAAAGRGDAAAAAFAGEHGMDLAGGRVRVIIDAAGDTGAASAAAAAAGGTVEAVHGNMVQARVPTGSLAKLAGSPAVSRLRPPAKAIPAVVSEGVADTGADAWQAVPQAGAGIRVAVLDGGFQGYQSLVATGELPANVTAVSFRADGDITGGGQAHGTACAEIVHDMAPESRLYLLNFETEVELGNAIDYLVSEGVDVVSASWTWPADFPGDGTGDINDMVSSAAAAGVLWVNAAGNAAQNHWSGSFSDADSDGWNEFSGSDEGNGFYVAGGNDIYVFLAWNDWPLSDQDYDLYLFRNSDPVNPVAWSTGPQNGSQKPSESLYYHVPPGGDDTYYVAIKNEGAAGDASFELFAYYQPLEYQTAAGSIAGQPADNADVLTVGAVNVGTGNLAYYSSQGPTLDGRTKPDIAAPTGVSTVTYGNMGFAGTSASTPHVAGAAALVEGAHPDYSWSTARAFLENGAVDLGDPGKDNLYGSGKLAMGTAPPAGSSLLFGWYDEVTPGMRDWVLLANVSAAADIGQLRLGGSLEDAWRLPVLAGETPELPGTIGGPVEVRASGSTPLLASQRVVYNGAFTELPAVPRDRLDSAYYFTWYDQATAGMQDWILVANEDTQAATVEIYIGDLSTPRGTYALAPGEVIAPTFPGVQAGPVYVRSTGGQLLLVSQRVLYQGFFSEVTGMPAGSLVSEYRFNWYDSQSPGYRTWILAANPGTSAADVEITIAGGPARHLQVDPGSVGVVLYQGEMGGPVTVKSSGGNLVVSERTLAGDSFEELQGADPAALASSAWFSWYDFSTPGMVTWLLVSNQGTAGTDVSVYSGGQQVGGSFTLAPGEVAARTYAGVIGGPLKVVSTGQPLLASERTVYGISFNEIDGTVIP